MPKLTIKIPGKWNQILKLSNPIQGELVLQLRKAIHARAEFKQLDANIFRQVADQFQW